MRIHIMVPDFQGKATAAASDPDGFIAKVKTLYPEASIVPVLNGQDIAGLERVAAAARGGTLEPLVCPDATRGMVGASRFGYATLLERDPNALVVKLDTAEHDINHVSLVADAAVKVGSSVAELDFAFGGLVAGSYDLWIHTQVFPTIYRAYTKDKLALSCAHGFQGHQGSRAAKALEIANKLVDEVERRTNVRMSWGFDAAMLIGAVASGTTVAHLPVPAMGNRDRNVDKINAQLRNHMQLLAAVDRLGLF